MLKTFIKQKPIESCFFGGIFVFIFLFLLSFLPDVSIIEYGYYPALSLSVLDVSIFFSCAIFLFYAPFNAKNEKEKRILIFLSATLAAAAFPSLLTSFIQMLQVFHTILLLDFLANFIFFFALAGFTASLTKKFQSAFTCHVCIILCLFGAVLLFVSRLLTAIEFFSFVNFLSIFLIPLLYFFFFFGAFLQFKKVTANR